MTTQAEQDAEDANISFLRNELVDEFEEPPSPQQSGHVSRRSRGDIQALPQRRHYQAANHTRGVEDLDNEGSNRRTVRQDYNGWAPGADEEVSSFDDEAVVSVRHDAPSMQRETDELRERMRSRLRRDYLDSHGLERSTRPSEARRNPPIDDSSSGGETGLSSESSLRTTALLQAVRRNTHFPAHSRNQLQRYILARERMGNEAEEQRESSSPSRSPDIRQPSFSQNDLYRREREDHAAQEARRAQLQRGLGNHVEEEGNSFNYSRDTDDLLRRTQEQYAAQEARRAQMMQGSLDSNAEEEGSSSNDSRNTHDRVQSSLRNEMQRQARVFAAQQARRAQMGYGDEFGNSSNDTRDIDNRQPSLSQLQQVQQQQQQAQYEAREARLRAEMLMQQEILSEHQRRFERLAEEDRRRQELLAQQEFLLQERDWRLQTRPTGSDASQSESRRRRYWHVPSSRPSGDSHSVDSTIKYLSRLRLCESELEGRETAEEIGYDREERNRQDFLTDLSLIPSPPESSWLSVGGTLSGSQSAVSPASSNTQSSFIPPMPPSQMRARVHHPTFGTVTARTTSPARTADTYRVARRDETTQQPSRSSTSSTGIPNNSSGNPTTNSNDERWPVKVTIQTIDYTTMTLAGTMEAFNVPDKTSPTRESSISTYLEGEIIDFDNHTLETKSFKADTRIDATYWLRLPPFRSFAKDEEGVSRLLTSKEWMRRELMEKWILMRWKGMS